MSESNGLPFISDSPGFNAERPEGDVPSSISDTMEWFGTANTLARGVGRAQAQFGTIDDYGRQITEGEPTVPGPALQQKYGIPGKLTFANPLPESVAASMHDTKREEIARADAIERRPSGLMSGAARYGAQFVADLLDPVNAAAVFVPGAPEIDLGASLLGRIGSRAAMGAISGAEGMVPLAGLKYTMGQQEQSDYGAYNALADIAIGAGIGAVLHVGGGAIGDYLTSRMRASPEGTAIAGSPATRSAALAASVAQMVEDRNVEVRPVLDAAMETEPGGWGGFPEGAPAEPEFVPEPPGFVTEPPIPTEPGAATPRASALVGEPREPQRLASFLVANGGVRDIGGDVRNIMGGWRGRPGLVSSRGMGLDDAAYLAWENGFFPEHAEARPSINELLDAIDDDLKGAPRYSAHNDVAVQNYQGAIEHNAQIMRLAAETGIAPEGRTLEQFYDEVAARLTPEDFDARVGAAADQHQATYEQAEQQAADWIAHHGTPHDFERFDTSKVGTGEGAQAYGHGLYFAENQGVAESYRNRLSRVNRDADFVFDGKEHHADELDDFDRDVPAARPGITAMMDNDFDPTKARIKLVQDAESAGDWERLITDESIKDHIASFDPTDRSHAEAVAAVTPEQIAERRAMFERQAAEEREYTRRGLEWFDENKGRITPPERNAGNLYTVRIKAKPEEMLDWDRPLRDQPEAVKDAFRKAGLSRDDIDHAEYTGGEAYKELARRHRAAAGLGEFEDQGGASAALRESGVKGIRYLDRASRKEGEGTHNVVVFSHDDIEITHKNGEPVEPHRPSEAESAEIGPHDGAPLEALYGAPRSLEDLENEYRQEATAPAMGEQPGGGGQPGTAAPDQGPVPPGGGISEPRVGSPGRAGPEGSASAAGTADTGAILDSALRSAAGERAATPADAAADAAAKSPPDALTKLAAQQVEDHEEFFRRAEAAGALTEEVRAELEAINGLDKEGSDVANAAMQAAACVARGLT